MAAFMSGNDAVHAVCPQCQRQIRIPADRVRQQHRCPACKAPVFDGRSVNLDDPSFDSFLARSDLPVLVGFWASWCAPCGAFAPVVAQAAADLAASVVIAKVDSDAAPRTASRLAIRSIPTVALFRGGRKFDRKSGAISIQALREWAASKSAPGQLPS